IVRRVCGIQPGDTDAAARARIDEVARGILIDDDARRVSTFLSEALQRGDVTEESPHLQTARDDMRVMADQVQRAMRDFLTSLARAHPTLLVCDDLQFADSPSLDVLNAALRAVGVPLLVVCAART